MNNRSHRTEILIETHEVKRVRFSGKPPAVYCMHCREDVLGSSLEQTAEFLGITLEDVYRFVEAKRFHLAQTHGDLPLICVNSLGEKDLQKEKKR